MTITTQGDTSTYSNGGTQLATALGVTLMSGNAAAGSSGSPLVVAEKQATGGTIASVASSATSVTLVSTTAARKSLIITNDSTAILYVNLANGVASTTVYSVTLGPLATGVASSLTLTNFTGAVTGIWASANGFARVTELL